MTLTDEGLNAWLEGRLSEYDANFVNYRTNIEELYRLANASSNNLKDKTLDSCTI